MAPDLFDSDTDGGEDLSKFEINKEYAKRFEHNKKREALQRLEEMKKKGLVPDSDYDESSEEDDEDEEVLAGSSKTDLQFFDTLVKVKKMDPIIQQKDAKLYSSSDDDEEEEEERPPPGKKEKPLYIKDVNARHLLEKGPDFEEENVVPRESQSLVYSKEQEENLRAFLEAANREVGDDSDDELLKDVERDGKDRGGDNKGDLEIQKKVDEYWGDGGNLDENELFLKDFLLNKKWLGKDKGDNKQGVGDWHPEVSDDEEELEKQEKFEAEYNFRYEEGGEDRVLGHARFTEGLVRKKTSARKVQRKSKEERMAQAEFERKEELKHLKNLKKKEIMEKLEKIKAIAGIGGEGACKLDEEDLEEEFDPEEYDRRMKETFGTDYYDAEDADPGFGSGDDIEKPDFDKEDELLGLPKDWDVLGTGDGFKAARERSRKRKSEGGEDEEKGDEDEEEKGDEDAENDAQYESKRKRKRKISLKEKVELDKELEEYYKLDYEDTIGDLKTRFKYKSVPSNRYGLSAAEILMTDDKELNQYVSLKKLAPYRPDEWKVHKMKRYQMKMKKMLGVGEKANDGKNDKKHRAKGSGSTESSSKIQQEVPDDQEAAEGLPSRRSRRRRRQAEIKLPQSRLMAYGKLPPKPKTKKH